LIIQIISISNIHQILYN